MKSVCPYFTKATLYSWKGKQKWQKEMLTATSPVTNRKNMVTNDSGTEALMKKLFKNKDKF